MLEVKYSENHVWVRVEGDGTALIGISDYAQEQLGDITSIELPEEGLETSIGEEISVIESVKSTSEIFSPLTGVVVEINEDLIDTPELLNESPLDEAWIARIQLEDEEEIDELMDGEQYEEYIETL